MSTRPLLQAAAGLAALAWGVAAQAQAPAAQAMFEEGRKALAAGDVETACARFHASERLEPAPGTEANIADCEERRGNVATAWEVNRTALGHLPRDDARRNLLQKRIAKLEPRLPRLVLSLEAGADKAATVRDGETTLGTAGSYGTPLPMDPGVHHLVVSAPSCAPWTIDVKLVEGKTETVAVGPCRSASSGGVGPWVVGGVGLAALLAGAVTGGLTVAKKSAVSAAGCTDGPPPRCPTQSGIDAAAAGRTLGVVTTASLIAGAAAVGAGALWLGVQRGKRPVAQVSAGPLPGGAALQVGGTW
jgi:hypothetical protein